MVTIRADEISNIIRERIEQYNREVKIVNTGTVLQVGDGIARIHGLDEVMAGELVEFEEGTIGIALNLESNNVGVVLMGDGLMIQEGNSIKANRMNCSDTCKRGLFGLSPLTVDEQIVTIYTGTNGYLDSLEIGQVKKFLVQLRTYLKTNKPQFQEIISSTKTFTQEAEALFKEVIREQMERFLLQEQT
uniref:ATP synthase subunit alpha, mitochondrial-like n=1 Tax=Nelumbo nucifera TaxID=4432 RepID=A0A822YBJ0_NELNU|nr:TPA_asm: hypothetical protein HUJ06_030951 [Nelumbo nucifera]